MKILLVEDDPFVSKAILRDWPVPADQIEIATTLFRCARIIASSQIDDFDAVILDMNLPDGNAIEALCKLRKRSNLPAIVISGIGDPESRASTLDIGADDYVMKPFSTRELQARVARAVNRLREQNKIDDVFIFGKFHYNHHKKIITSPHESCLLTDTEARLLFEFISHAGKACSRQLLSEAVCLRPFRTGDKTIDIYVGRLRSIFSRVSSESVIQTVRGVGYRFLLKPL